jgi:hypothetical protein
MWWEACTLLMFMYVLSMYLFLLSIFISYDVVAIVECTWTRWLILTKSCRVWLEATDPLMTRYIRSGTEHKKSCVMHCLWSIYAASLISHIQGILSLKFKKTRHWIVVYTKGIALLSKKCTPPFPPTLQLPSADSHTEHIQIIWGSSRMATIALHSSRKEGM